MHSFEMRCNILNGICIAKVESTAFLMQIVISTFYFSLHNIKWNYRKEIIYILIWRNVKRRKSPKYKKKLNKINIRIFNKKQTRYWNNKVKHFCNWISLLRMRSLLIPQFWISLTLYHIFVRIYLPTSIHQ